MWSMSVLGHRLPTAVLLAVAIGSSISAAAVAGGSRSAQPIVSVILRGGLTVPRVNCRATFVITDTTISGCGYASRRLDPGKRRLLLRAIRMLDRSYLSAHPFRGTCPTAYDGQEAIYRFRGFDTPLASCTYDLRGVRAVQIVNRLLGSG